MDTKVLYDRPSPRLRKVVTEDVTIAILLRMKWIPQEAKRPYRLLLKVITTDGEEGWVDP
jgi:hypothetical protein